MMGVPNLVIGYDDRAAHHPFHSRYEEDKGEAAEEYED
jgi:hypothetical protein